MVVRKFASAERPPDEFALETLELALVEALLVLADPFSSELELEDVSEDRCLRLLG